MTGSEASKILLKCGILLTHDEANHVLPKKSDLLMEGSTITKIAANINSEPDTKIIDCNGKIISPGFIDTHRHLYQSPFKGRHANQTLIEYMASGNFTASLFSTEDLFWGQLSGAMESIDAGTTTVVDHSSCNITLDHPPTAIQALLTSGLRTIYCYTPPRKVHSWKPCTVEDDHFSPETRSLFQNLALAAPFGNGKVHIGHAIDNLYMPADTMKAFYTDLRDPTKGKAKLITSHGMGGPIVGNGPSAVQILAKHNLLGPDILISHANFPHDGDGELFANSGAHVSSTPSTELQMGNSPVALREDHYHNASIGVDCHSWTSASIPTQMNMLLQHARCKRQLDLAEQKGMWSRRTGFSVEQVFNLGTVGGAKAVGLGHEVGKLQVGMKADVVIFDAMSPSMLPAAEEDPVAAIVLHSSPRDIEMVIVDGVVRKESGRLRQVRVEAAPMVGGGVRGGGKGAGVEVGTMLGWKDVSEKVLESRKGLEKKMESIDFTKGEEYVVDMFYFDRNGLLEEQEK